MNATGSLAPAPAPPLRVLSLDGGGIRGKSSLLILENIMETIRKSKGLESTPKPCEYFDLIGGTSTGGIIAIMLGRLRMTVDECIRAYSKVAQIAFTSKRTTFLPAAPEGAYSARALESAIKQTVREYCVEPQCVEQRRQGSSTVDSCPHEGALFRDPSCTKTAILTITKVNVDGLPTLLRTYDMSEKYQGCTIWQVARATSAATTFFKSIKLGRDNVEFIDAGFGYNNPCEVLIDEAQRQFPDRRELQILSIGTGLGKIVGIKGRRSILKALEKMASTSTRVAQKLDRQLGGTGQYYRFNVDRGLEDITLADWEKESTIAGHTDNYLENQMRNIQVFVDAIINPPSRQQVDRNAVNATVSSSVRHYISLPMNNIFVGREETLRLLNEKLFAREGHQRVCLYGLGGIGKTQVALRIAYEAKDARGLMVIWLSAANSATFKQYCAEAIKRLSIPTEKDEDFRESLQRYLNSDQAGSWLLVIDNIDQMETLLGSNDDSSGIHDFLPDNDNGRILFTTRFSDIAATAAGNDVIELKMMTFEEAKLYLEEKMQSGCQDDEIAKELLAYLTCLPLAITQAAMYMKRNKIPIRTYLDLLRRTKSNVAELLSWEFHDKDRYKESQNAVALTWQVSFKQISREDVTAAELLKFISTVEPKAIPFSMLPTKGSEIKLRSSIGTLIGYAFLDVREEDDMFDMHRLVHLATRTWVETQNEENTTKADALAHLSDIFQTDDWEDRHVWRQRLPHVLRFLEDDNRSEESAQLRYWAGRCLHEDGQHRDAVQILKSALSIRETTLAETDADRLTSQYELARAYQSNGQITEAIALLEHVVSIKKTTLAETHPNRLASQHELARAYQSNGQITEAIALLEHVVSIKKTTLAETHPNRLASQHELARAYLESKAEGQVEMAIKMLEHVVSIEKITLAETNPGRLTSQHELAGAYLANKAEGQIEMAVEILERVVSIRKTTLAENHPELLASQHELARAYLTNKAEGQVKQAVELLKHVVSIEKTTLREDDPSRLMSQKLLKKAYRKLHDLEGTQENDETTHQ
ncbi:acyl transferase/acyl hydrolase/lysophospholipase [Nemania sp. FL0916]|nr:acyl transferase/acyl hydrolase/lysophospholipase [Nemania sp. FL0916]